MASIVASAIADEPIKCLTCTAEAGTCATGKEIMQECGPYAGGGVDDYANKPVRTCTTTFSDETRVLIVEKRCGNPIPPDHSISCSLRQEDKRAWKVFGVGSVEEMTMILKADAGFTDEKLREEHCDCVGKPDYPCNTGPYAAYPGETIKCNTCN